MSYHLIEYRGRQYAATPSFWGKAFFIHALHINVWPDDIKIIGKLKLKMK